MHRFPRYTVLITLLLAAPLLTGCNLIGAGAILTNKISPPKVEPEYKGLAGQSVAIMVWSDRGIRIDYPTVQIDCATSIQNKMIAAQQAKSKELLETKFPVPPSIARYQAQYPQAQSHPITEVAHHIGNKTGVTRLIYVELDGFSTRPSPGVDLFRGSMAGSIKVLEIKDGKSRIAYEESDVHVAFPKKSPEEGTPNADDQKIYVGTLNEFTTDVVKRFITYEDDE